MNKYKKWRDDIGLILYKRQFICICAKIFQVDCPYWTRNKLNNKGKIEKMERKHKGNETDWERSDLYPLDFLENFNILCGIFLL